MPSAAPSRTRSALVALLLLLAAAPAQAWWPAFNELGLGLQSHTDLDIKGGNLGGLGLRAHAAAPLHASDSLRLDLRLEATMGGFWNYASGSEITLAPGLRLYLPQLSAPKLTPFLEGGLGLSLSDLHIPELGTRVNFLSYAGLGLRHPISPTTSLDLGYRLRHISNAGLDDHNHGLTSHMVGLEAAWFF